MMQLERQTFRPITLAIILACLVALPAYAAQIVVEAEDYIDFYNYAFTYIGPLPVGVGSIVTLQGLDYPGEWVDYTLPVSAYGSYSYSMICWGDYGVTYTFNLYFIPDSGGDTQVITVSFVGKGCFT